MAYLQQIATSTSQPRTRTPRPGFIGFILNPKTLIIAGASIVAIILLVLVVSLLSSVTAREQKLSEQLYLRLTNLNKALDDYTGEVKSSSLRTMGHSLSTVFANTTHDLEPVLTDHFKLKTNKLSKSLTESETKFTKGVNDNLNQAKLNGLLDRSFTREFALQIALVLSLESELLARTKYPALTQALQSSKANLEKLHDQFANYHDKAN